MLNVSTCNQQRSEEVVGEKRQCRSDEPSFYNPGGPCFFGWDKIRECAGSRKGSVEQWVTNGWWFLWCDMRKQEIRDLR